MDRRHDVDSAWRQGTDPERRAGASASAGTGWLQVKTRAPPHARPGLPCRGASPRQRAVWRSSGRARRDGGSRRGPATAALPASRTDFRQQRGSRRLPAWRRRLGMSEESEREEVLERREGRRCSSYWIVGPAAALLTAARASHKQLRRRRDGGGGRVGCRLGRDFEIAERGPGKGPLFRNPCATCS